MLSCADFLREFSEYRDGEMAAAERARVDSHLAMCGSCSRYVEVIEGGVRQLRSLPAVEPREDFLARLQHQIYNIEAERMASVSRSASGVSVGFVLVLMTLITISVSLPLLRPRAQVVVLPPVAAVAPAGPHVVPPLFREGPLLIDERSFDMRRLWTSRVARTASWQPSAIAAH